jgi:hypothetical protein
MGVLLNEKLDVLANEKSSVLLNLKLNFEIGYFPFWATNISYHLLRLGWGFRTPGARRADLTGPITDNGRFTMNRPGWGFRTPG